jgi:hypothetical protein
MISQNDFTPDVRGKIVILVRGDCTITVKSQNAGAVGAVGVVVYNVGRELFFFRVLASGF